ncbi:hypothetical protein MPTK1_4g16670 [Marchantia polymorpha subsp. ruderalis]|uniref:Uncharacterized protein n=2 Tax=Marchantia polymorpha TaxID=3197 RepID=A0AAF6BAK8_MARPO|nr:hypothetical protein MARPO_0054s0134 [Marchantia polymorpha]PTQ38034.1 hypothetical protein MARPO_0054s0134 [Marchantia polymorpha]BBN09042.1 hypothetical protein Mp_4g16670 [Marchantia polymorpha subsp. ruderalis]BBN09043.1 hypothetical protein Mp_4g16670 [Marchantia polymorpha subsp. ruderalis]|eukprot:PTQ38033.1 hypothetical protein MARPO_0054s0134 [Marchantia polymorpha]
MHNPCTGAESHDSRFCNTRERRWDRHCVGGSIASAARRASPTNRASRRRCSSYGTCARGPSSSSAGRPPAGTSAGALSGLEPPGSEAKEEDLKFTAGSVFEPLSRLKGTRQSASLCGILRLQAGRALHDLVGPSLLYRDAQVTPPLAIPLVKTASVTGCRK